MANVKISDLATIPAFNDDAVLPVVSSGVTYKQTVGGIGRMGSFVSAVDLGADKSGVAESHSVLQNYIDSVVSAAVAANSVPKSGKAHTIVFPHGQYKISSTLRFPPWMRLVFHGAQIDATGLQPWAAGVRTGRLFDVTTEDVNMASTTETHNLGPIISSGYGGIFIQGPGSETDTYLCAAGNFIDGPGNNNNPRNMTIMSFVRAGSFGRGLWVQRQDTYMLKIADCYFGTMTNCIVFSDAQSVTSKSDTPFNSGEAMSITDCTLVPFVSSGGACIVVNAVGYYGITMERGSLDFSNDYGVLFGPNAGLVTVRLNNVHIERANRMGVVAAPAVTRYDNVVILNSCIIHPSNPSGSAGNRSDGASAPDRPLFTGNLTLHLSGANKFEGYGSYARGGRASQGVFLCDANVKLLSYDPIKYLDWQQIPHRDLIINENHSFEKATAGTNLFSADIPGWVCPERFSLVSASVIAAPTLSGLDSFDGSPNILRLSRTGGSASDYFLMRTKPIDVSPGQRIWTTAIVKAPGSTGDIRIIRRIFWYRKRAKSPVPITSIARGGTGAYAGAVATVTTSVAHGLIDGDIVTISGAAQSGYNRTVLAKVVSPTTFEYRVDVGTVTPATGALSYALEEGGLELFNESANLIESITSTLRAKVTTTTAHGLITGDVITLSGATQTEFNRASVTVRKETTNSFSYPILNYTVATATGSPVYSIVSSENGATPKTVSLLEAENRANVVTLGRHGLRTNDKVDITGCTQTEFNRTNATAYLLSNTSFYYVLTAQPTVTTVTGNPTWALTGGARAELQELMKDGWNDTTDPLYTGDRNWALRTILVGESTVPVGAQKAVLEIAFDRMAGDTVDVHAIMVTRS